MGKLNSIALLLLLIFLISLFVFTRIPTVNRDICSDVPCGQGRCRATSPVSYSCDCNPGWKKAQIGTLELQACVLPNCTVNKNCPAMPPSSPISFESLRDINTTACSLAYCGAGHCEEIENHDFKCVCNEEAANINAVQKLPCVHKCHLEVDCQDFHISLPAFLPP